MATYIYEASDGGSEIARGKLEAEDIARVAEYLGKRNLIPLKITEESAARKRSIFSFGAFERLSALDRIFLIRNLGAAVHAGLDIIEAVDILIMDAKNKTARKIFIDAKANLENGQPLSYTMSRFPRFFPSVCVGMVRAGEASGRLDESLQELNEYLTKQYDLTKRVRAALAYPLMLLSASVGVVILLLIVVLPRLKKMFEQTRVELPFATRMLVRLSDALTYNIFLDIGVVAAVVIIFIIIKRTERGKLVLTEILLRIPYFGSLVKKVALVRITKTLGNSLASGIAITEAIDLASESVSNPRYSRALSEARDKMKSGVQLSKILSGKPSLFPGFFTRLLFVGEKTGSMEYILKTFSDFYADEVEQTLKNMTGFLEPALLLCMGLIIGWIALSLLLPIYQLVSSFR